MTAVSGNGAGRLTDVMFGSCRLDSAATLPGTVGDGFSTVRRLGTDLPFEVPRS